MRENGKMIKERVMPCIAYFNLPYLVRLNSLKIGKHFYYRNKGDFFHLLSSCMCAWVRVSVYGREKERVCMCVSERERECMVVLSRSDVVI